MAQVWLSLRDLQTRQARSTALPSSLTPLLFFVFPSRKSGT